MDKREAILQAALELFAERGFHGTPVPLIAQQARVGAGTIYRYFKDKEQLVNVLYRIWKSSLHQAIMAGLPEDLPLRTLFGEMFRRWVAFVLENRTAYSFLIAHHHAPYLDEASRAMDGRAHEGVLALFEQGRREQVFKDAAPEMLLAATTGILGEIMKSCWAGRLRLDGPALELAEEMCWQAVRR